MKTRKKSSFSPAPDQRKSTLESLPDELVTSGILSFFDRRQLALIASLNKNFYNLANDHLLQRDAPPVRQDYSRPRKLLVLSDLNGEPLEVCRNNICVLANEMVAVSSLDNTVRIWDPISYECVMTLNHDDAVISVRQLSDGSLLTSSLHQTLYIWNIKTGECIERYKHEKNVGQAIELTDGRILFYSDHRLHTWNRRVKNGNGVELICQNAFDARQFLQLSNGMIAFPDNDIYSQKCDIHIFDLSLKKSIHVLSGLTFTVFSILELSGQRLAATDGHGNLGIWNYVNGERLALMTKGRMYLPCAVEADDKHIICGDGDGNLQIWDIQQNSCVATVNIGGNSPVRAIAKLPDGRIICGKDNGTLHIKSFACLLPAPVEDKDLATLSLRI